MASPPAMTALGSYKINMNSNLQNLKRRSLQKSSSSIVRAQLVEFQATRRVDVPFRQEGARKGEDYIKETERIVKITFPDSSRINYLGDNVWRARLRPVTFFTVTAIPFCDVKVFHTNKSLQLASNRLVLDLKGLPGQNDGFDFQFSLQGELLVHRESASVLESEQTPSFRGWVTMGLNVDLPLPFSLMPDYIILPVGNGILDRILGAMEGELASRIIRDYNIWCHVSTELTGTVTQLSAP
jgi:hypothetical protein